MADIAKNTVKLGDRYYMPGEEIEGLKAADRKLLLAADAITTTEAAEPTGKKGGKAKGGKGDGGSDSTSDDTDSEGGEE